MDIKLTEDLWASCILPEGIMERWLVPDGATVGTGERVAEVRIEDALHEVMSPASGRITISVNVNDIVEPGSILGHIDQII